MFKTLEDVKKGWGNMEETLEMSEDQNTVDIIVHCESAHSRQVSVPRNKFYADLNLWADKYRPEVEKFMSSEAVVNFPKARLQELEEKNDQMWKLPGDSREARDAFMPKTEQDELSSLRYLAQEIEAPYRQDGIEAYLEDFVNNTYGKKLELIHDDCCEEGCEGDD